MREEVIGAITHTGASAQGGQDTILEVALRHDEVGHSTVELRHLIWGGTALGWYRQQTLTVSGTTLRQLLHSLGIAQCRLRETNATAQMSNVIPFPRERAREEAEQNPSLDVYGQVGTPLTGSQR